MTDRPDIEGIRARCEGATGVWEEEWRPVPGHEGHYDVSNMGRVRSYFRPGNNSVKLMNTPRIMTESRVVGYRTVNFKVGGKYLKRRVHRVVLETFVGPCPPGHEGAHLNGDRLDNRLSNLVWATHPENEHHKIGHGTVPLGEVNGQSKLVGWQVAEIRYLLGRNIPQQKIADLFDMSRAAINEIANDKRWPEIEARTDVPALLAYISELEAALTPLARVGANAMLVPDRWELNQYSGITIGDAKRAYKLLAALLDSGQGEEGGEVSG